MKKTISVSILLSVLVIAFGFFLTSPSGVEAIVIRPEDGLNNSDAGDPGDERRGSTGSSSSGLGSSSSASAGDPEPFNVREDTADGVISEKDDAGEVINDIIRYITVILTGLFVLMMLIGAIYYMVFPDTERKQKGMTIMQAAVIAGIFAILSYSIWKILEDLLTGSGSSSYWPW